jgi:peptidyl-dipeptidase Dcp
LIIKEMVALRAERAALFGKSSHSEYVISRQTAKTPERVEAMMRKLAPAALANAKREAAELQDAIAKDSQDFQLASWDWSYYTEKVRQDKFQLDTAAMKPYFEIESVIFNGVFFAAEKLFGLKFLERPDLLAYHPQARVFEVFNEDGSKLGLYIADLYTRDSKRGGAWMNTLVDQSHLLGQFPVVVNNMNIPKPPVGEPTLLTYDETRTFFHEFGHALHGLLSSVKYPKFSGTSVERDFVEFPSQVNEMWMLWPEIVRNYARHYQTGEELPKSWIESLDLSESFNEGFATTSYLAAAVLDLALHSLPSSSNFDEVLSDLRAFESNVLSDYGLSFDPVPTRYRAMHFSHIFAGGYSAGYYGYIWSEVLDADTVEWFKSSGGLVRANGDHFRKTLLSKGGSLDSMEMYREFRGRDAVIEPLLKRRGLIES